MRTELIPTIVIDFSSEQEKRVLAAAIELGMKEDEAKSWLESWLVKKAPSLNFVTPCSLLGTEEGTDRVIQKMQAIVYGVYL